MNTFSEENTVKYYDIIYKRWIPDSYTMYELNLIKHYLNKEGKLLDIGCGSGRHIIPLFNEGYNVEGVEPLQNFVNIIKAKSPKIKTYNCSSQDFVTEFKYDVIISMWNAFHQLAYTRTEAIVILEKMKDLLNDKGKIILSMSPGEEFDYESYNFTHTEKKNNRKYVLDWKVIDYNKKTNTVRSKESIKVYDKNDTLIDHVESIVKQRYWKEAEIKEFVDLMKLKLEMIKPQEGYFDSYYIIRK